MSEYEIVEATVLFIGLAMNAFAVFFTFVSGYLVVAYFIGQHLSRVQLSILNALFFVVSGIMGLGSVIFMLRARFYIEMQGMEAILRGASADAAVFVSSAMLVAIVLASYYFMWSIRKNAT